MIWEGTNSDFHEIFSMVIVRLFFSMVVKWVIFTNMTMELIIMTMELIVKFTKYAFKSIMIQ